MNNLIALTDHVVLDQQDYLREARQRALVRKVKADRKPKARRQRTAPRLVERFAA